MASLYQNAAVVANSSEMRPLNEAETVRLASILPTNLFNGESVDDFHT